MSKKVEGAGWLPTRRDVLIYAAHGAVATAVVPRLGHAQGLVATDVAATRTRESFDFGWKFRQGDQPGAELPAFVDSSWRDVELPHDWSIEGSFAETEPSGGPGAYLPTGVGWYRKRFNLPGSYRDRKIVLEIGGIYQNSEIWINGHSLGLRPYGFIPFAHELTPHLHFDRENLLAVRADNSRQTNCRWYSGSGIYRHTWLLSMQPVHVGYWGTYVTCPRVGSNAATVEVKTAVVNQSAADAQCSLTTTLLDASGNAVASQQISATLAADGTHEFVQQIALQEPHLWSPATPYLYTVRSEVYTAGRKTDVYDTPTGIREAVFDADRGFLLNGQHLKLNGVCIHQEAGCVGAAVPERVWERRLEILRDMGCNAIRASHNPYAASFLDLCDRMGFVVMAEAFDEWKVPKGQIRNGYSLYFDEWHERDLLNFIHSERNHPSIVIWSSGNEIGDQSAPDGAETLRELLKIFHAEDPTRPVTAACDQIASEPSSNTARPEFLALLDVVGYNYVDRWRDRAEKYYSIDRAAFPQRRFIGTESGGMGGVRGDYRYLFPSSMSREQRRFLLPENRDLDVEALWQFVRTYDYVSGDFMWTGIDYLGEAFWPMKGSSAGVIDTCGFMKDGYYFYQSQWTSEPVLHVFPHWNWEGTENEIIPVTCYTNCDAVELFVNGKSFGVKGYEFPRLGMEERYGNYPARARVLRTTADLHLSWDVPYTPGALKVVGMRAGETVKSVEILTSGKPVSVALSADRTALKADRRDVAHIAVTIVDEQGRTVPTADNEVTFTIQGEARLIGVDNGDMTSHENYKADHRKAFNGMCLAILQSNAKGGAISMTASSPGLKPATLALNSKA